ncbi:hypothetical protein L1887_22044 [Cichorium endivia]|nr:hypothetical protein L1887_22044 [Cichorium endivia]
MNIRNIIKVTKIWNPNPVRRRLSTAPASGSPINSQALYLRLKFLKSLIAFNKKLSYHCFSSIGTVW